jgi:GNAT superfamily N-acetyltransferase
MKKLLLYTLLINASIYAMQDLHIVPFEYDKHHETALNIFKKALPRYSVPRILNEQDGVENNQQVEILIGSEETSKKETIIGLVIHCMQSSTYHEYFDFFKNGRSKVSITRDALKNCTLEWLCIDPGYQRKGYGEFMLNHLEAYAKKEQCDLIDLAPTSKSKDFYKKCNYTPRFLTNDIMIAKGLNDDAKTVLSAISREHPSQ